MGISYMIIQSIPSPIKKPKVFLLTNSIVPFEKFVFWISCLMVKNWYILLFKVELESISEDWTLSSIWNNGPETAFFRLFTWKQVGFYIKISQKCSAKSLSVIFFRQIIFLKVRSLFKDCKQLAGCSEFHTETGMRSLVSVWNSEHPAICLQSLKRERTLMKSK